MTPEIVVFFVVLFAFWTLALGAVFTLVSSASRKAVGWLLPFFAIVVMLAFGAQWQPWQRLLASTLALLYLLKATILLQRPRDEVREYSKFGLSLYFTVWPGMNPQPFRTRSDVDAATLKASERLFVRGAILAACGVATAIMTCVFAPQLPRVLVGWFGTQRF